MGPMLGMAASAALDNKARFASRLVMAVASSRGIDGLDAVITVMAGADAP
jgi:hypothetical protein